MLIQRRIPGKTTPVLLAVAIIQTWMNYFYLMQLVEFIDQWRNNSILILRVQYKATGDGISVTLVMYFLMKLIIEGSRFTYAFQLRAKTYCYIM